MEKRWVLFFVIFIAAYGVFFYRSSQRMKANEAAREAAMLAEQENSSTSKPVAKAGAKTVDTLTSGTLEQAISDVEPTWENLQTDSSIAEAPVEVLETKLSKIKFSCYGAVPISWEILPSEYSAAVEDLETGEIEVIELVPQVADQGKRELPLQLEGPKLASFNSALYEVERSENANGPVLTFRSEKIDGMQVVKTFEFDEETYITHLTVEVINGPSRVRIGDPVTGWGLGWQGGFMKPDARTRLNGDLYAVSAVGEEFRVKSLDSDDEPLEYNNNVAWAGHEKKYFTALLVPHQENPASRVEIAVRKKNLSSEYEAKGVRAPMSVVLTHPSMELQPTETSTLKYTLVVGPKYYAMLKSLDVPMIEGGLPISRVTFPKMFWNLNWVRPICLTLLSSLHWFESKIHNWGWSIILLVLVIKTLLYPLSHWAIKNQAVTMAEQAKIRPYLDKINEKYKDDPSKKSQEMMKLYREHNINPFGAMRGCFPMLLQMPIFFALYILLDQAVELRGQSFLWVHDLSAPDRLFALPFSIPFMGNAFNVLPILMAVTQYFTSRLMSTNISDPMQRQMMYMMPVLFFFITYSMPSGLMLYWTVQNIWQIGHTVLTKRYVATHDSPVSGGPTASGAPA